VHASEVQHPEFSEDRLTGQSSRAATLHLVPLDEEGDHRHVGQSRGTPAGECHSRSMSTSRAGDCLTDRALLQKHVALRALLLPRKVTIGATSNQWRSVPSSGR
jgi:hypothetical protein